MNNNIKRVLVTGATGSVGREVVNILVRNNLIPVAMVRDALRGKEMLGNTELFICDLQNIHSLKNIGANIDAIIFTHGSSSNAGAMELDYAGVANVLHALECHRPRIVLMTSIYVTQRSGTLMELKDWKRRSERLLRASGLEYTIVRPGYFDLIKPGDDCLILGQGDKLDGGVGRRQIADVLVQSLLNNTALSKTFELVAGQGNAPDEWGALFKKLVADNGIDGAMDSLNMPLADEPENAKQDLARITRNMH
ncbi:hypothetical protein BSK71_20945 [Pectobacterium actinidiae]|uniref:NAD(P)-binding domain-containing protein n=2 Tax=Pectobacterium actinidiae TaxID=1507808 RepID=A0A1V2QY99_9GAMM|nr:SDR family oxidoreductase [Pectobacterium actinidiae]KHN91388.1 hypothetical protein KKH3_14150 [Pectobacterium actinidiae]ONK01069.1 hypothetical protein BSK69_20885 [Pectobacterium actinidiae]ONK01265.1 hypothetical protein BSK71_20945 [Pectobacterium actinidiae]